MASGGFWALPDGLSVLQLEKCAQDLGNSTKAVSSAIAQLLGEVTQGNENYTGTWFFRVCGSCSYNYVSACLWVVCPVLWPGGFPRPAWPERSGTHFALQLPPPAFGTPRPSQICLSWDGASPLFQALESGRQLDRPGTPGLPSARSPLPLSLSSPRRNCSPGCGAGAAPTQPVCAGGGRQHRGPSGPGSHAGLCSRRHGQSQQPHPGGPQGGGQARGC